MAKKSKKKVKFKASSSPKYVTSDEDNVSSDNYASSDDDAFPSELVKNPNVMIKCLMKQVGDRDELLEQQEELLIQERKISKELKKLLALKKGKVRRLINNLLKARRLLVVSRA
jgi:hypothetical protein